MSKDEFYPAYKWHPENAEQRLFHKAGDVPEGWLDTHPANLANVTKPEAEKAPAAEPAKLDMTRKEIVAALADGGIKFDPASKVAVLYELLKTEVKRVLVDAEIEFEADAGTKALLELLPKPE